MGVTLTPRLQAGMGPYSGVSLTHVSSEGGKGENMFHISIDGVAKTAAAPRSPNQEVNCSHCSKEISYTPASPDA